MRSGTASIWIRPKQTQGASGFAGPVFVEKVLFGSSTAVLFSIYSFVFSYFARDMAIVEKVPFMAAYGYSEDIGRNLNDAADQVFVEKVSFGAETGNRTCRYFRRKSCRSAL